MEISPKINLKNDKCFSQNGNVGGDLCAVCNAAKAQDCRNLYPNSLITSPRIYIYISMNDKLSYLYINLILSQLSDHFSYDLYLYFYIYISINDKLHFYK